MRRLALAGALAVLILSTAVVVSLYLDLQGRREPPPELFELPPFDLVDQRGEAVTREELAGSPWIADFIFTRCALYCPRLTSRMAMLGSSLPPDGGVARVSLSVDPAYDTPEVLAAYADSHGVEDPRWLFLTGESEHVRQLILEGFKVPVVDVDPILHSNHFVLVDESGVVRGYYDATDGAELERLVEDLDAVLAR